MCGRLCFCLCLRWCWLRAVFGAVRGVVLCCGCVGAVLVLSLRVFLSVLCVWFCACVAVGFVFCFFLGVWCWVCFVRGCVLCVGVGLAVVLLYCWSGAGVCCLCLCVVAV